MSKPVLDCVSCGACCVADDYHVDRDDWVQLEPADFRRLTPKQRRSLVILQENQKPFVAPDNLPRTSADRLRTKEIDKFGTVCACLEGIPGVKVACTIYKNRPVICREFQAGERACLEVRKLFGFR